MNKAESEYGRERGINIINGDIASVTTKYDHICMFQILEHFDNPKNILELIRSKNLNPSGRIHIEVPSLKNPLIAFFDCKEFRQHFFMSAHKHYFTPDSLCRLIDESGYEVSYCEQHLTVSLYNNLGWLMFGEPSKNRAQAIRNVPEYRLASDLTTIPEGLSDKVQDLLAKFSSDFKSLLAEGGYGDIIRLTAKIKDR